MISTQWLTILYTIVLCAIVVILLYALLYYSFNKNLQAENDELAAKLADGPLQSLLNGSGINNIPLLNIISTNPAVTKANNCGKGPVYIGNTGSDSDCIKVCANSSASVINVEEGETFISNSSVLQPGAHCIIGPRPECNMKTTDALMTINSIVCRPKFPNLFGGPTGTNVVACNNRLINDPQNYLWDYKYNQKVDPWTTVVTDEDELLNDGAFRFRCRFNGYDVRQNKYMQHPFNRFHPISNYCASQIYRAHPDVQTIFKSDGTFECDCGNAQDTRVQNLDPNDKSSLCSNIIKQVELDIRNRYTITVPYKCFTLYSLLEDVGKYPPCPNDQFTREGSQMSYVTVPFTTNDKALIEHPMYADFASDNGIFVDLDKKIT